MRIYLPNQYSQQRQMEKPAWVYPVRMAMEATYWINKGEDVSWEIDPAKQRHIIEDVAKGNINAKILQKPEGIDFLSLPIPNRVFSMAFDKRYQLYGNYKYHPATHMMAADGCWHGDCVFCVEKGRGYRMRPIDSVLEEIGQCSGLGFREIFDDSGTFPIGAWLKDFCRSKSIWKDTRDMILGCNMRVAQGIDFGMMKRANFRMILVGVESSSQTTLTRIQKGISANDIIPFFQKASQAGLEPHAAVMFGYPWSTYEDDKNTLDLVHFLLRKGYAKTAQASIYTHEGRRGVDRRIAEKVYDVWKYPDFWIKKLSDIRKWEDFLYLCKSIRKGVIRD